jgi:hypothetical protein
MCLYNLLVGQTSPTKQGGAEILQYTRLRLECFSLGVGGGSLHTCAFVANHSVGPAISPPTRLVAYKDESLKSRPAIRHGLIAGQVSPTRTPAYFWSQAFHTGYYYHQCEGLFELQCSLHCARYGAGVPPTHGSYYFCSKQDALIL